MGASTSRLQDQLEMFRRLPTSGNFYQAELEIPEREENRVPTNTKFLIVLGVMILVLLPFVIYTLYYADRDRSSFYDQCGNFCGKKNVKYDRWCTGQDYRNKKLLQLDNVNGIMNISLTPRRCVSRCDPNYEEILGELCVNRDSRTIKTKRDIEMVMKYHETWLFLQSVAGRLIFACLSSVAVALSVMSLFGMAAAKMVWGILVGVVVLMGISVASLWISYFYGSNIGGHIAVPVVSSNLLVALLVLIPLLYKKIVWVAIIFKEAAKAISDMPCLLLVPIVAFIADLLVGVLFLTVLVYIRSAGTLKEITYGFLEYKANIVMSFSIYFTIWMAFWINRFLAGIQYMVIAGAVSKWFFAKNKNNLNDSVATSAYIAVKFHMGSAAFGSLVLTLVAIIRSILSSLFKNEIPQACLSLFQEVLKYLTKNAYIMTAMHGKPFFQSGKMAAQILLQNVADVIALTCIVEFIILMACALVMLISLLLTYFVMLGVHSSYEWSVYAIVGTVSLIVAAVCFSIFQTVIDTIFLCFCEDKLLNDGIGRPYAMSRDLMEFVEKSKKMFGKKRTCL